MKKALLIGINYTSMPDIALYGCIEDIINMRNMLIDAYDFTQSNIIMLRDDSKNINLLPTGNNIIKQLELLVKQTVDTDEIWIHFSGHGSQINNSAKIDETIIPIDYRENGVITGIQLLTIVQSIKCTAILIFDSCHSGTICDLQWLFDCKNPVIEYGNIIIKNPNIYIISSCKDSQRSADTYNVFLQESVGAFSNSFIECLRNSQHNIPIMKLYQNICVNLAQNGYTQSPMLSSTSKTPSYIFNKNANTNANYKQPDSVIRKTVQPNFIRNMFRFYNYHK